METVCDDGTDNDGDAMTDCGDPDCATKTCGVGLVCGTGSVCGPLSVTIAQARQQPYCANRVRVANVVVTAVDSVILGAQGDYSSTFWVADPSNAQNALMVTKFFQDTPGAYRPTLGDLVTIDGWFRGRGPFEDRVGYRQNLSSGCPGMTGQLNVTLVGTMVPPPDLVVPAGFGNSDGGVGKPNPNYAGARVRINGPLTLTQHSPQALHRVSAAGNADPVYFGFEVSGGILVNNYKTAGISSDAGVKCDWRAMILDGGTVTFPNGIAGIWDTFTHAPCADGGTMANCFRGSGLIPGTTNTFTFALFPQDCANDLAGVRN